MAYDILGDIQFFQKWDAAIKRLIAGKRILDRRESLSFLKRKRYEKLKFRHSFYSFGGTTYQIKKQII